MAKSNKTKAKAEFGESIEVIDDRSTLNAVNVDIDGYYEPIGSTKKIACPVIACWPTAITLQGPEGVYMEPYWNFVPVHDLAGYKIIKRKQEFEDHR